MNRGDLLSFAQRDWAAIERHKADYWAARKRQMSATDVLMLGDALRRHVVAVRPDWPDEAARDADHAAHRRLADALRAAADHHSD